MATILWIATGIIALAKLAQFWGLYYGNTDDLAVDFQTMAIGPFQTAFGFAFQQARVHELLGISLYSFTMSLAGSGWYDLLNLSAFVGGSVLPVTAFYRYLSTPVLQLYVIAYFSTLPLLFSYCPPYSYPTYMFAPLAFCGAALLLFDRSRDVRHASHRTALIVLACVALFLALCGYEPVMLMSAAFIALHFWLSAARNHRSSLLRRPDVLAAIGVCVFYFALYVGWRLLFPPSYNGVQPAFNLSVPQIARVVGTLSLTSSIFARYWVPQMLVYDDFGHAHVSSQPLYAAFGARLFEHATVWQLVVVALTIAVTYKLVVSMCLHWSMARAVQVTALGVFALFWPNALYAFIPKLSNLVLTGQLVTYTGTAFSQIGFSLLCTGLVTLAVVRSNSAIRAALAVIVAIVAAWASLASFGFNRVSQVYVREQGAKWSVIHQLAACRNQIPATLLDRVTAPRLWNFSTAPMSWMDGSQYQHYWDRLALKRYHLNSHFYLQPQAPPKPLTLLDYHLAEDGNLSGIVLGFAPDGIHFREVFIIKDSSIVPPAEIATRDSKWLYQGPENTTNCGDRLQIVRFTGSDLNLGTTQVYDLPSVDQLSPKS
ncbi:MAG: hypothetical protein WA324_18290 [Bryobacteraceae bacterium]